jgi:hypothetical protein
MNCFPNTIHSDNQSSFEEINYERVLSLFRQEVYELLLKRKDDNEYIDLDSFAARYCNRKVKTVMKMTDQICSELKNLGWNTKLSFGDTGLFIYSTENPPISCW